MEKPYKFLIICNLTNEFIETDRDPAGWELETWVATENANIKEKKVTKTLYVDTRYKAKLRLYNYITYTRKGLPIPKFNFFEGTEVGKSIPILNF